MLFVYKGSHFAVKGYKLAYYTPRILTLSIMVTATDSPLPIAKG
jgi:hypothetical protein